MVVLIIVGFIFSIFSIFIFYIKYRFLRDGSVTKGTIIAIEKQVRRNRRSGSSTVFYYPILKYRFRGSDILFRSSGSSNGLTQFKIGEVVKLLSLPDGPAHVMLYRSFHYLFGTIFGLSGSIALFFGFKMMSEYKVPTDFTSLFFDFSPLIFIFVLVVSGGVKIFKLIKEKNRKSLNHDKSRMSKSLITRVAKIETKESLKGRELYTSNEEINKIIKRNSKVGFIITAVFMSGCFSGTYYFWTKLSQNIKGLLLEILNNIESYKEIIPYFKSKDPNLIGFSFLGVMCLLLIYSSLFTFLRRK